jgi:hypothetical protein
VYSKKIDGITFYNAKNNFKELNIKEIDPSRNFNIYVFFNEEDEITVRINENSYLEQNISD